MIKLLALDLDGTLVNHDLKISDHTLQVLRHLVHKTDVRVVVATGRMHPSAMPFVKQIQTPEPVVTYQGAMIRKQDEAETLQYHKPIEMTLAKDVLSFMAEQEFNLNLYVNDVMYTNHKEEYALLYAKISGILPITEPDLMSRLIAPPSKIMAIDDARVDTLLAALKERFPDQLSYYRSRTSFCEIIHRDASKWNAVNTLAAEWGIQPSEVMAIGDQENDLSMLSQAGLGVAMGNAPDNVKAGANEVTESVENDGAVAAIQKYIFDGKLPEMAPLKRADITEQSIKTQ